MLVAEIIDVYSNITVCDNVFQRDTTFPGQIKYNVLLVTGRHRCLVLAKCHHICTQDNFQELELNNSLLEETLRAL